MSLMPAWGEDNFSCIDIYYRIIRGPLKLA